MSVLHQHKQADSLLSLTSNMHVLGKEARLSYSHPVGDKHHFKRRAGFAQPFLTATKMK